jgi:hydrogenase maturation protease
MKDRILIIGYGSPIRGDDAIGPLVADRLIDAIQSEQVVVYSRHILTAELVGEVADAAMVIFLDASVEGVPGEVCCRPLTPIPTPVSRWPISWTRANCWRGSPPSTVIRRQRT